MNDQERVAPTPDVDRSGVPMWFCERCRAAFGFCPSVCPLCPSTDIRRGPNLVPQARRLVKLAAAMNSPSKLAALIGEEKARAYFDEQREVADCRRDSANSHLLDMRLD